MVVCIVCSDGIAAFLHKWPMPFPWIQMMSKLCKSNHVNAVENKTGIRQQQ